MTKVYSLCAPREGQPVETVLAGMGEAIWRQLDAAGEELNVATLRLSSYYDEDYGVWCWLLEGEGVKNNV